MVKVGILAGSGYTGGELLRLLIQHPEVEVTCVTSRRKAGDYVYRVHPTLRGYTNLRFEQLNVSKITDKCDVVFSAAPHCSMTEVTKELIESGLKVIDLSADYRLKDPSKYEKYYNFKHPHPDLLEESVYGLPEIHRSEIKKARLISCPGCIAAASILALAPLVKSIEGERIIVDAMIGSSGAGSSPTSDTHHPERFNVIRPYKPVGHRHTAEIEQELSNVSGRKIKVALSTYAVNVVRGILAGCHLFTAVNVSEKEIWRIYREFYAGEPFIQFLKDQKAKYRLPDPKIIQGSNICLIGFEIDQENGRIVSLSAIDNLVKGAAGNAVQCLNIILGVDEKTGLSYINPHPI